MKTKFSINSIFRWIGSILILLAAVSFMLEGWTILTPAHKLLSFWGFSFSLAGLAVVFRSLFKDETGAKTLENLCLLTLPAQFVQLGSYIYEYAQMGPEIAVQNTLLIIGAMTIAISGVLFKMILRQNLQITASLWILCMWLLIPDRSLWIQGSFASLAIAGSWLAFQKNILPRSFSSLHLLWVPVIILGRASLHSRDDTFWALVYFIITFACFNLGSTFFKNYKTWNITFQYLSLLPLLLGFGYLAGGLKLGLEVTFLLTTIGITLLGFFARPNKSGFYWVAATFCGFSTLALVCITWTWSLLLLALGTILFLIITALIQGQLAAAVLGGVSLLVVAVDALLQVIDPRSFEPWMVLAAGGLVVLLASAGVNRYAKGRRQPLQETASHE